MKLPSPIRSIIAVSLLLLFTLQAGLGLYLHNAFHKAATPIQTKLLQKTGLAISPADAVFPCSCVDDFLVPFTTVEHPVLPQTALLVFIQHRVAYYNYLPHSLRIFRSLRAPPAIVS